MKRIFGVIWVVMALVLSACGSATANKDEVEAKAVAAKPTPLPKVIIPAGRASLSLVLTSVARNGKSVPVETQTYVGVAKSTKKRDAGIIGGAAGVGAVIGAIAGGGKGSATGAAIGGAGGTGAVLATRGEDVHYPSETRLTFVLSKVAEL